MTRSAPHAEHDWLSATYVNEWIESDATRDGERRPKLRRAASFLPFEKSLPIRVLDIGGGYGEFSAQVLEEFPNSTIVLHDFSEPMIAAARGRLIAFEGRVDFRRSDLSERGWSEGLGGPFDAAVSAIAIHNLRKPATIHAIYNEVFTLLAPGGAFLNLDYIFPSSPLLAALYSSGSAGQGWRSGRTTSETDGEPASLANQLRWLLDAGFAEVDCLWKDLREVLICALRSVD